VVIKLFQDQESKRSRTRKLDHTLHIPWRKPPSKRRREIVLPDNTEAQHARLIRAETRATLVAAIARGRRWLKELVEDATITVESIAKRERCSMRQVNMTISLAFLAPNLVKAAIEGRLPRGIGVERLRDAPVEWSRQYAMLGLTG
jgi:site-specific DNA recombinase